MQFKRCVTQPAPVALAIVDHDEAHAVTLDANFDEDWGDSPDTHSGYGTRCKWYSYGGSAFDLWG